MCCLVCALVHLAQRLLVARSHATRSRNAERRRGDDFNRIAARGGCTIAFLLSVACTASLDEEQLVDLSPPFADVHELCVRPPPAGVSQGTALSLPLPSGSIFLFADTLVETGSDVSV